jgi:hypothetical protein
VSTIGTLNESPLHAAVKDFVGRPGDAYEAPVEGFIADIRRGERIIEIQTRNFGGMGRKLDTLLDSREVTLVHPIAARTIIHRPDQKPRRSPVKRGFMHVFDELIRIPTLIDHPRLTVRVLLIEERQERVYDPKARRGRGGWRVHTRHLEQVIEDRTFENGGDLADLLPTDLPAPFSTADLAERLGIPRPLAQKTLYCLRHLAQVEAEARTRSGVQYLRAGGSRTS